MAKVIDGAPGVRDAKGSPKRIEKTLGVYFLQQWYGPADEALEHTIYSSQALRLSAVTDLSREGVDHASGILASVQSSVG